MWTYEIKKDGFVLGTARGKNKAVERIKKHLEFMGIAHLPCRWKQINGNPACVVTNGTEEEYFTTEKAYE